LTRKAIATLKKIITVDPANIQTAIKLADLYAQAGLPSEARHHYVQIAEALTRKGMTLDALTVYNKVVDLDPSNTSGRIKLGELYLREGMNDQAYDAFVTAADQLAKGSSVAGAKCIQEALAIKPDNVEVKAAARGLSALLGVVTGKTVRNAPSQITKPVVAPPELGRPGFSSGGPFSTSSRSEAVTGLLSTDFKAKSGGIRTRRSGYCKLRDVLRDQPDSIDLHIKLKDIYLRNGMMADAAHEYAELERIHDARGESERARDYAVRASRLTQLLEQPSGDLAESADKASAAASRLESASPAGGPRLD
jgi:tetratricopeptide (TPR) repeat protein